MFLKKNRRKKNGREFTYYNIVENRRCSGGKVVQRQVLYLGELNSSQLGEWRRTIDVFDQDAATTSQLALFEQDRLPEVADDTHVEIRLCDRPGVFKPGSVINDICAHEDMLPMLLATAGDATVKEDLLKGRKIGNMTYKVHLDAYNLLPAFKGEAKEWPRKEFLYMLANGCRASKSSLLARNPAASTSTR